jgi:NADH:ubiquinone oxidoreductase subunit 3 (subunit A)
VGVDASLILFAATVNDTPPILVTCAGLAMASMVLFVLSLFWGFTRLEHIERLGYEAEATNAHADGMTTNLPCFGMALLAASFSVLCFWKSPALGWTSIGAIVFSVLLLMALFYLAEDAGS